MKYTFNHKAPFIHPSAYVGPSADLIGDVVLGEEASVWFASDNRYLKSMRLYAKLLKMDRLNWPGFSVSFI